MIVPYDRHRTFISILNYHSHIKKLLFLIAVAFGLCCKAEEKGLRSLIFIPDSYYYGMGAQEFTSSSIVTYRTENEYKTIIKNEIEQYSVNYHSTLRLNCNPADADVSKINFHLYVTLSTLTTRALDNIDYSNLFTVDNKDIRKQDGVIYIPVSISKENLSLLKYNKNHQVISACVCAECLNEHGEKIVVTSDYFILSQFISTESVPLKISFSGISWWDLDGDYSINLDEHVFQVAKDRLDDVKDSIQIEGNRGFDVNIHKVDTDDQGITRCCVVVEKSQSEIYAYKYIKVRFTDKATGIVQVRNRDTQTTDYYYNLNGQRTKDLRHGVYIYKRRKYILK